jgi:carbamoyltransferase
LKEFQKVSGIPAVLNTSFNDNGEPIVETPRNALESFKRMDIDYLIIGDYIVRKN